MSTIFSVICYPSGFTIPPNLPCYRSFEVYLYDFSFDASHIRRTSQLQDLGDI